MSESEKRRSMVLNAVVSGAMTLEQATRILNLSYRQMKRVWKRFREEGERGLAHRNKGKPSNRAFVDQIKNEVLQRYSRQAQGMGPTRFADRLAEQGIVVDHETLRRWLLQSGAWKLSRNRQIVRPAEVRTNGFGELLNLVSVHESWLGEAAEPCFLVCMRDKATGRTLCALSREESCETAMRLLWAWIERYGIPAAVRCQRRFLYAENRHPTLEQQLCGGGALTALSRSCDRLGVESSPMTPSQVKGILHEMMPFLNALADVLRNSTPASIAQATTLLQSGIVDALNGEFSAPHSQANDYHVAIVDGTDLRRFLCVDQECRVNAQGIVEMGHRQFRLTNGWASHTVPLQKVVVSEWLDGSVHILSQGREIPFVETRPVHPCPDRLAM
jgi:transposase